MSSEWTWERSERADRIRYSLARVAGSLFWLETEESEQLSLQAGIYANELMNPEYNSDEALDCAEKELKRYEAEYEKLKQKKRTKQKKLPVPQRERV